MGKSGFTVGPGGYTVGPGGFTAGPVGSQRGPVGSQRGPVGSQRGHKWGFHELVAHRRGTPPEGSAGLDHRGPEAKAGERLQ